MAKSKVFEYMVIYHPKAKKNKSGEDVAQKSEIIVELQRVLAKDEKEVGIRVARELPEQYVSDLDNVEILVRPF